MKKFLICTFLAFSLVFILCSCSDYIANTTAADHILSIGLCYKNTAASELRGTINDALEVGASLERILNSKNIPRKLTYMLQEDLNVDDKTSRYYPSKDNILAMIESMTPNRSDMITLFYSGHGQNVYWGKCPLCGYEFCEFASEEGNPGQVACPACGDSIELLDVLSRNLASSGQPGSDAARKYLGHEITKEDYIEAMQFAGGNAAKEILSLSDYMYIDAPVVALIDRGFFVTAPLDPIDFQVWLSDYAVEGGVSGWLLQMMSNDYSIPHAASHFKDPSGYYADLYIRMIVYGADNSQMTTFSRFWNIYLNDCWMNTYWTKLYMDDLIDALDAKGCRALVLADCCYSGFITVGRDDEKVSFGNAFLSMFSGGKHHNVTTLAASTPSQTSLDSLVTTEEGDYENHGLFTISLLKEFGWEHSSLQKTYELVCGEAREIAGYQKNTPLRASAGIVLENIKKSWSYQKQTPNINSTYLNTILIP